MTPRAPTPDQLSIRTALVEEACSWLRTPFRDQADVKGAGVDCAMLLVRCLVDSGACAPFDPRPYPPRWHLHRSEERFLGWLEQLGYEVTTPTWGDVVVYQSGRCFSHGGFVMSNGDVLHASWKDGMVLLSPFHEAQLAFLSSGKPRAHRFFDLIGPRP